MPHTIYFRVGNSDRITLNAFISKLRTFLGLLEDFDSALSDNPRGSMKWEIVSLRKNSPPEVGIDAVPRVLHAPSTLGMIEEQVFSNIALLSHAAERGPRMPDAALMKMKSLATGTKKIGPSAVFVEGNGRPRREEQITESTLRNVRELTAIEIANGIEYGLSSAIYTRDVNKSFRAMRDLHAGITYINAPTIGAEVHLPFGGVKATGNGHREGGIGALDFYTEWKSIYVDYSDTLQRAQIDNRE